MHKMLTLSRYELNNCLPSAEPLEVHQEQAYNSGRLLVAVSALLSLRFPFPLGRSHFLGSLVKNGDSAMDVKYRILLASHVGVIRVDVNPEELRPVTRPLSTNFEFLDPRSRRRTYGRSSRGGDAIRLNRVRRELTHDAFMVTRELAEPSSPRSLRGSLPHSSPMAPIGKKEKDQQRESQRTHAEGPLIKDKRRTDPY